jgi:glycosyltransferase involved in cell wall biosynthesis
VRALVVTVVHHPEDSRIRHRQIAALLDAGWDVTYAASFTEHGLEVPRHSRLTIDDLPRASGRRRLRALRAARSLLRREASAQDVVLLHDPELLAAAFGLRLPPVVWDVHEDTAAAVTLKPWLPRHFRPLVRWIFRRIEHFAERRLHLILAEYGYQDRFKHPHLVVPNVNHVPDAPPPPDRPQVIYVGSITRARGADELVETARLIADKTGGAVRLKLIGPAAGDVKGAIQQAVNDGFLDWSGFLPAAQAMDEVRGSMAGLSLLRDEPNYRVSLPTKVVEYMANGVPVITTPLPLARNLVEESGCGVVIPFRDAAAAADAILELWSDRELRARMGNAGHRVAKKRYDWSQYAASFVSELARVAATRSA